jgi:hypothetical protein
MILLMLPLYVLGKRYSCYPLPHLFICSLFDVSFPALSKDFQNQAHSCQEAEAESTFTTLGSAEN